MTARKMLGVSLALLFAASTLSALQTKPADLTGTWTGTLNRSTGESSGAHMVLTQKGADLTGTAGPSATQQLAIANGKVATVKGVTGATFQVTQPNGAVLKFDLKVVEGRLKGTLTFERDGQSQQGTVDVGRETKK